MFRAPEALSGDAAFAAGMACVAAGVALATVGIARREWLLGVPVALCGALLGLWYVLLALSDH